MNKAELNQSLEFLLEKKEEIQIIVYAILKNEERPKKLDITANDLPALRDMFIGSIENAILKKEEYSVLPLSTADERGRVFYHYDLDLPEELSQLEMVIGNDEIEVFTFENRELSDISSLIIVLADNEKEVSIYKKISPVEVLSQGNGFLFSKSNQRLSTFNEQLLRISYKFQALRVNDEVIILDLESIEKFLGFAEVIKREAQLSIDSIRQLGLVDNIETLEELIDDISFARKLTKVAKDSPVIKKKIPNDSIIKFAQNHPATKKLKLSKDGLKILLDTKKSKNLFVKLMNDDYLSSELTKSYYDSLAKNSLDDED